VHRIGALVAVVCSLSLAGLGAASLASAVIAEPPANVRMTGASLTAINLTWDPVDESSGYTVTWSKSASFDPGLGTKDTDEPSVSIDGLTKKTTYYLRVRATLIVGETEWSAPVKVTTGPALLRIGSYNIKQPDKDTAACGNFTGRARDIMESKVDVLGIQEAYQGSDRVHLMDALRAAGGDEYAITLPEGAHGWENGWDNRLVYNTQRVELINSTHVPFKAQDGSGTAREFVWGTFEHKANGHRFLVYTTHLEPGGTAALKKAQWDQIRANAVRSQKQDGQKLPVFIVGDYNTSKFRQPADSMLPKMKSSGFGDVLGQTYRSYKVSGQRAKTKTYAYFNSFNDCKIRPSRVDSGRIGNNIDWIFASNELEIPAWRTFVRLKGTALATPIPSDHFLVTIQALLP